MCVKKNVKASRNINFYVLNLIIDIKLKFKELIQLK